MLRTALTEMFGIEHPIALAPMGGVSLAGARLTLEAGADVIVVQCTEAGGHGAGRSTLPLVPAVVDAVAPRTVLAAGGIADGRGLAAALMLGAQGALIGTPFYAGEEALGHPQAKRRIVDAHGEDTCRTTAFDVVRKLAWPEPYNGRALRNGFIERWRGREEELAAQVDIEHHVYASAVQAADHDVAVVWAGEGVDLVNGIEPAGDIVQRLTTEAADRLRWGGRLT